MKLRVLDLFSGIGGFSLGLERTGGFETVAFCEIEPYPRAVLAKHWPDVPIYDDVRTLTADALRGDGIAVDVICGGFPCQDVSVAGKRAGLEGARSGLWREYARLIGEIRPRFVIVENVPGLLNLGMGAVLGDLAALRYDAVWDCIPASSVGAPHRRDRVWVMAYTNRGGGEARDLASPTMGYRRSVGTDGRAARDATNTVGDSVRQQQRWQRRARGEGATVFGDDGKKKPLADAERWRRNRRSSRNTEPSDAGAPGPGVSNANVSGLALRQGQSRDAGEKFSSSVGSSWWHIEPDVGGSPDGFPLWLYRCVGWGLSYAESVRRSEVLRELWNDHVSQALWRAAGGLERISQAEVLFSFVREYEAGTHQARLLVAGEKAPEGFLRGLRQRAIARSAPHRSGSKKQRSVEHSDAVQPMPRLLARNSEADWTAYSWEDAVPRVANGTLARVDRLKGLGNAVVPQIPELIGRAILQAEGLAA